MLTPVRRRGRLGHSIPVRHLNRLQRWNLDHIHLKYNFSCIPQTIFVDQRRNGDLEGWESTVIPRGFVDGS